MVGNVLINDMDPDGHPLSVVAINGSAGGVGEPFELPSGAVVVLNENGVFEYDFNNAHVLQEGEIFDDRFDYTIDDGHGGTDVASVDVRVTGVFDPDDIFG